MSRSALKGIQAAAGAAGGDPVYVDDLFSTYLYTSNGSGRSIVNGVDLAGEGGLVWSKIRGGTTGSHCLIDTARGVTKNIHSNASSAETTETGSVTAFNSNGYTIGTNGLVNYSTGYDYVSWTFRKQPGFFDVVTYTGNGSNRTIIHSLGSVPGVMIVKRVSDAESWQVYHKELGTTEYLELDSTNSVSSSNGALRWNSTRPTATEFSLGTHDSVNANGSTYVAYLFAHDAQDFGEDSDEAVIKCGSYTGNGTSTGPVIDLGFEPQWLMIKCSSHSGQNWMLFDAQRGVGTGVTDNYLMANDGGTENSYDFLNFTSTGFQPTSNGTYVNANGYTYTYMAIRRPHKPASELAAVDLFTPAIYTGTGGSGVSTVLTAPLTPQEIDLAIFKSRDLNGRDWNVATRMTGGSAWPSRGTKAPKGLHFNTTDAEADLWSLKTFTSRDIGVSQDGSGNLNVNGEDYVAYRFSRAPGFFDVVTYEGNGVNGHMVNHNLGVVPEMIWVKNRGSATNWLVYHAGNTSEPETEGLYLNTWDTTLDSATFWHDTSPTATQFSAGRSSSLNNQSGDNFIAYLFASVAGISKVGNYAGTGNDINVDCGFTNGSRFVMIKRTDASGDWYVFDTARGIVAGNDGYLRFNNSNDEETNSDYIDPLSSGFTVTSSAPAALNASGGNYIFYAIA